MQLKGNPGEVGSTLTADDGELSTAPLASIESIGARWGKFCDELPHQEEPFSRRNWGSAMHSLCSYQGKLKPALAHHLVEAFTNPGDVVVDPFSGAGTVPFEACRTGRAGFGIDISALGYVLTRAKVRRPALSEIYDELESLEHLLRTAEPTDAELKSAQSVSFNSSIPDYFHSQTLREVLLARRFFLSRWGSSDAWAFVYACCLHILHGNRPYALSRKSHPITPFKPTGPSEYRELIPRLSEKIDRAVSGWDTGFVAGTAQMGDATTAWGIPRLVDAVITSPPFFDSTRFYMTNWMRYWFSGWEREDFDIGVSKFVETRQRKSFEVYAEFFLQASEAMRSGGHLVMHLGFSKKCDMATELAKVVGDKFSLIDVLYEGVEHCESHGVRDKGTVSGHSYLVLRRE